MLQRSVQLMLVSNKSTSFGSPLTITFTEAGAALAIYSPLVSIHVHEELPHVYVKLIGPYPDKGFETFRVQLVSNPSCVERQSL